MIIGHSALLRFLSDGVRANTLNPSLLFVGPEGVGKRTVALRLVQALLCATPQEDALGGCGACDTCRRVNDTNHDDVIILNREMQARILKEKVEKHDQIYLNHMNKKLE